MDGRRFDDLARGLAAPTRRGILRWLLGGALGGVIGSAGETVAAASCRKTRNSCREHANCCSGYCAERDRRGRRLCACANGQTECTGVCADLDTDRRHCGGCGVRCGDNSVCVGGRCLGMPGAACEGHEACASELCVAGFCCSGDDYCVDGELCCDPDRPPTATCCGFGGCCECFSDSTGPGTGEPFCCDPLEICGTYPADECCRFDEECFEGHCVRVKKLCEGRVCPNQCCNGECCGPWDTCGASGCVPLSLCTVENEATVCSASETCARGGAEAGDMVCCPDGRLINFSESSGISDCCPFGGECNTSRGKVGRF
jgi:hypothetical protein